MGFEKEGYKLTPTHFIDDGEDALLVTFHDTGETVKYVPERTCHMTLRKSGPFYDVWHFDCCDKEWSEARCDNGVVDYPGIVCPYCGAKVVE